MRVSKVKLYTLLKTNQKSLKITHLNKSTLQNRKIKYSRKLEQVPKIDCELKVKISGKAYHISDINSYLRK